MPNFNELSLVANTNITPSTFVTMDPNNGYAVLQATGTSKVFIGISQKGTDIAGGLGTIFGSGENNYAAVPGEGLEIFVVGDVCPLSIGSGGCVPGQLLTSDGAGLGIVASGTQEAGAIALDFGNSGDLTNVLVVSRKF